LRRELFDALAQVRQFLFDRHDAFIVLAALLSR